MISEIQKYFAENSKVSLLFVFEDIDYYINETKQVLLYKILDMLQYCQIKFLFIATSMKVDVVDSFEKRVKSRFSHRQVILYDYDYKKFQLAVENSMMDILELVKKIEEDVNALKLVFHVL